MYYNICLLECVYVMHMIYVNNACMHIYVCMWCIRACIYACTYGCRHMRMHVCLYVVQAVHEYVHACMHVCMNALTRTHTHMDVYIQQHKTHTCIYNVCFVLMCYNTHTHIYIYIYVSVS